MGVSYISEYRDRIRIAFDAIRLCDALSHIEHTPLSALCEVIDNSVQAKAKNITVLITKACSTFKDSRQNNVKEYLVIDDGSGIDEEGLKNALELGASDANYEPHSLSKFGLGLKSAAFSQGNELHLISSPGDGAAFKKFVVSLPEIEKQNRYFARHESLTQEDQELINKYLSSGRGTIVRIGAVRMINHPSVKKTVDELKLKAGVIYYYFIKEQGVEICIEDVPIPAFDVLFVNEANANGNLDEHDWDGKSVRWIEKQKEVLLDKDANVKARVEVTQLPHPPIHELDGEGKAAEVREKYKIGSGNYGYYVYRNNRLISWAERFEGIIPQDQDFFSFRGRILIDDTADEAFNIDVKKSTLTLSDEAWKSISDRSLSYKSKSKKAWLYANTLKKARQGENPTSVSNEIAADIDAPETLSGEPLPTEAVEQERNRREEEVEVVMKSRLRKTAARQKSEKVGHPVTEDEIDKEDLESVLKGESNPSPTLTKIFKVQAVEDNALWEPYFDTDSGVCVRINMLHRFARQVYEENSDNTDLQVMFDLLLLQMAEAEIYAQKSIQSHSRQEIEKLLANYRRITSELLASMCRESEGKLPPL